jgi:hypothetical protein
MRQDRVGIPRYVYAILVVALIALPLIAAACGGGGGSKTTTHRDHGRRPGRRRQ